MASSNNLSGEFHPEKIIINTGPSLRTVVGLIAFGAALGAGAVYYFTGGCDHYHDDAVLEGVSGGHQKPGNAADLTVRVQALAKRIKNLTQRAGATLHTASEVIGPAISDAVHEGREAAKIIKDELSADLKAEAPAPPVAPEQA